MRTPVLIVGAGPTGLTLAATLQQHDVDVRIIDKRPGVLDATKSAALHARTLEYFRDLDVAEQIQAEGHPVEILTLRTGHRDRVTVDFRTLRDTAFPRMVDIPQARTECVLIDHLAAKGVAVERNTELTALDHHAGGVRATVTNESGGDKHIDAEWVVGCDGVHSTVRRLLGLDFEGAKYADDWVLCDATVDWPLPRNEMTFSADGDGIYGVFPLPGHQRFRLAYTQRVDSRGALIEPDLADAQQAMARTGIKGTVTAVDEFWTFNLAHRQAASFRRGRVFLAGDAAHVHTPFGGQGLNVGVGDAVNLGWKLADVCAGRAQVTLLDSYGDEREPIARQVVAFTHLGATAMLLRRDPRTGLRDALFAGVQHLAPLRRQMASRLSQLSHSYATGITRHVGGLRAGDRLPDPMMFDGLSNQPVRLHDVVRPVHTVLLTGCVDQQQISHISDELDTRWNMDIDVRVITPDWKLARALEHRVPTVLDRARDAAVLYGRDSLAYCVRPDRHIGYLGPVQPDSVNRYFRSVATTVPVFAPSS